MSKDGYFNSLPGHTSYLKNKQALLAGRTITVRNEAFLERHPGAGAGEGGGQPNKMYCIARHMGLQN